MHVYVWLSLKKYSWFEAVQSVMWQDYRLYDRTAIASRDTDWFHSLCIQTGTGVHLAFYQTETGWYITGGRTAETWIWQIISNAKVNNVPQHLHAPRCGVIITHRTDINVFNTSDADMKFSLFQSVQTSSGMHPASRIERCFSEVKAAGAWSWPVTPI
jgi:hypothetical protein